MRISILIATALALLVLVACTITGGTTQETDDTVKIGVAAPLSGHLALFGERVENGVTLAQEEINANGGINGKQVELIFEDSKCEAKETATALHKLHELDNVAAIIGPFCGTPMQLAAEYAEKNNIVVVTPNHSYGKLSGKQFSILGRVKDEDKLLAEYSFEELGLRKIGLAYQDNYFGAVHRDQFTKHFEELGGEITHVVPFEAAALIDIRTDLLKIGQQSDGLFIAYSRPGEIMNQVKELGLDLQIISQWGMENPHTLSVAGENAEGAIYTFPDIETDNKFLLAFAEEYDKAPSIVSMAAYDSLLVLDHVFDRCGNFDTDCAIENMMQLELEGATGSMKFDPDTWNMGRSYVMKTVKDGKYVTVSP